MTLGLRHGDTEVVVLVIMHKGYSEARGPVTELPVVVCHVACLVNRGREVTVGQVVTLGWEVTLHRRRHGLTQVDIGVPVRMELVSDWRMYDRGHTLRSKTVGRLGGRDSTQAISRQQSY